MSPELQQRILADQERSKEQKQGTKLRAKIEELLAVGVSQKYIAQYLDCPIRTVNAVTKIWKRDKLPLLLQKRANLKDCSA
jgi:hypothetical protein